MNADIRNYFESVWKRVWKIRKESDLPITVTPEYGPVCDGYQQETIIVDMNGKLVKRPEIPLETLIEQEKKRLEQLYSRFEELMG